MKREMAKYELPEPEFYEERGSFKVIFRNGMDLGIKIWNGKKVNVQSDTQSEIFDDVLMFCKEPKTAKEIREHIGISSKRYVAYKILKPLIALSRLEYTNKKSINARNQKYVTVKDNKK